MSYSCAVEWVVSEWIGVLRGPNPAESAKARAWLEREGLAQIVTVRPWPFTMAWRLAGCGLRNVMFRVPGPETLSPWTLFRFQEFCTYELAHARRVLIWFEEPRVEEAVVESIRTFFSPGADNVERFVRGAMASQRARLAHLPNGTREPTGCHYCVEDHCVDDLVCHATNVDAAMAIIQGGCILSLCKVRGVLPQEAARDPRNAAGDPPDYFEYVMWAPGNCTAIDKLVLERSLGHVPSWEEFETRFQPAVRFFFAQDALNRHPRLTFDGIHAKIRDVLELDPYLLAVVLPEGLMRVDKLVEVAALHVPRHKIVSLPYTGLHFKEWAHTAYHAVRPRLRE